ncbi:peptidoglycan-binding protein [Streptomyces sp. OF3]|uniref:Peptidoglycan-binding protein n=1 Tax=Streptomyces alkaliterrae TaxID=2213162 RepID=A0A7W3WGE7_9ACTN|nr:peptidoglycan-binding protein [Streptomyces alkaliterrae]MBB1259308.1 peptidoglycan-binding protein [Streptomyces alkaliterrae]
MEFVSRAAWGARKPTNIHPPITKTRGVKVHYLGTRYEVGEHSTCAAYVRRIQNSHMDGQGWADIAYSVAVCEHGYVFEGRGAGVQCAANGNAGLNRDHYAVLALVGSAGHTVPTKAQVDGIRDAIAYLRRHGGAGSEIRGHRDGYATECPGAALYTLVRSGTLEPGATDEKGDSAGAYTVRSGDTLTRIGAKLGVRWQDLASLNGIRAPYLIRPGQRLKIPGPQPKRTPVYQPFPGAAWFKRNPKSPVVTAMGKRLVAEGCSAYRSGPGPQWTNADRESFRKWQRKLGDAPAYCDGWPGKRQWDALKVPHV